MADGARRWRWLALALLLAAAHVGGWAIVRRGRAAESSRAAVVTVLAQPRYLTGSLAALRVMVTDHRGSPLSGVPVTAGFAGRPARSGRTDATGSVPMSLVVPAEPGPTRLVLTAASAHQQTRLVHPVRLERRLRGQIQAARPDYRAGETVVLRARLSELGSRLPARDAVTIRLANVAGQALMQRTVTPDEYGVATALCPLDLQVPPGVYQASVGLPESAPLAISDLRIDPPPLLRVDLRTTRSWYLPNSPIEGTVAVSYPSGVAAGGLPLEVSGGGRKVGLVTGPRGEATFRLPGAAAPLQLIATVQAPAGTVLATREVPISEAPYVVSIFTPRRSLQPGVVNRVGLVLSLPDGQPATVPFSVTAARGEHVARGTTTRQGAAWFDVLPHPGTRLSLAVGDGPPRPLAIDTAVDPTPLHLTTDRAAYNPGETCRVDITARVPGPVTVDLFRDEQVLATFSAPIVSGKAALALPLTNDMTGLLRLHGYLPGGAALSAPFLVKLPQLRTGVSTAERHAEPGRPARCLIAVTDAAGQPCGATVELSLAGHWRAEEPRGLAARFAALADLPLAGRADPLDRAVAEAVARGVTGDELQRLVLIGLTRCAEPAPTRIRFDSDRQRRALALHAAALDAWRFGLVLAAELLLGIWLLTRRRPRRTRALLLVVLTAIAASVGWSARPSPPAALESPIPPATEQAPLVTPTPPVVGELVTVWPALTTGAGGVATADAVPAPSYQSWRLHAVARSRRGELGVAEQQITPRSPLLMELVAPVQLTVGDRVSLPCRAVNNGPPRRTSYAVEVASAQLDLVSPTRGELRLGAQGQGEIAVKVVAAAAGAARVAVVTNELRAARGLLVQPDGIPADSARNGRLLRPVVEKVTFPEQAVRGTRRLRIKLYPSLAAHLADARGALGGGDDLESLLAEGWADLLPTPPRQRELRQLAHRLSQLLLVAGPEPAMAADLVRWGARLEARGIRFEALAWLRRRLLASQATDGGWGDPVTTARCLWALAEHPPARQAVGRGVDWLAERLTSLTPRELAWAANALVAAAPGMPHTGQALGRLIHLAQERERRRFWSNSPGRAELEATALATRALAAAASGPEAAAGGAETLLMARRADGGWGRPRATAVALEALVAAIGEAGDALPGTVEVLVNGSPVTVRETPAGGGLETVSLDDRIQKGELRVELRPRGGARLIYQVATSYALPWPAAGALRASWQPVRLQVGSAATLFLQWPAPSPGQTVVVPVPPGLVADMTLLESLRRDGHLGGYRLAGNRLHLLPRWRSGTPIWRAALNFRAVHPGSVRARAVELRDPAGLVAYSLPARLDIAPRPSAR